MLSQIMPDWFYRTLTQPLLFRFPPAVGRDLALGLLGAIARVPLGTYVIDVMGHMIPDARLARTVGRMQVASPSGMSLNLDMCATATQALSRFGVGLIEVGPVGTSARSAEIHRDSATQSVTIRGHQRLTADALAAQLPARRNRQVMIMTRIAPEGLAACDAIVTALRARVSAVSVELTTRTVIDEQLPAVLTVASAHGLPVFGVLSAHMKEHALCDMARAALAAGCEGLIVDATMANSGHASDEIRHCGPAQKHPLVRAITALRRALPGDALLIANGGIHQPGDALEVLDSGAALLQLDSGLIFSGPGLVKRINDAILHRQLASDSESAEAAVFAQEPGRETLGMSWFWLLWLGLAMLSGAALAAYLALVPVVLPYDEVFVGLSRAQLHAVNSNLLGFLTHDRITLAGLMATLGIGYSSLAWFGARRGWHWAEVAVLVSATVGALSFFLFLGFGYFEPFHGFVTVMLSQFLIAAARSQLPVPTAMPNPSLIETRAWRLSLWGQLCWILFGIGLIGAGVVIAGVGITRVFVPQDLAFLNSTADALRSASPRLLPLIAHDRATVGGMLLSAGLIYLLSSLWGFRRGERWLWRTMVIAAVPSFAATLWVHWHIGYLDAIHLAPLAPALALFMLGAALSHDFLCQPIRGNTA